MASLRRAGLLIAVAALLAVAMSALDPAPDRAQANFACDAAGSVAGGIGMGSAFGDACDALTNPALDVPGAVVDPLKDAASAVGNGIFKQITGWVAEGATWLLGEVAKLSDSTTSPNLLSKGFLRQYKQMAQIAVVMAALMVLAAIIEAVARADAGM